MAKEIITDAGEALVIRLLSSCTDDQAANIIASSILHDRQLPMNATISLLNMISTIATLLTPLDRAAVIDRMRRVSDLIEHELVEFPADDGSRGSVT